MKITRLTAILIVAALLMAACVATTGQPHQVIELGTSNFTSDINDFGGLIQVDTINEHTSANGVAIDGLTIKDGGIGEAFTISGQLTVTGALDASGAATFNSAVDIDGNVSSGTGALTITDQLLVDGQADAVQLTVQGYTTQTNVLALLEQSDGTDVLTLTNSGGITLSDGLDLQGTLLDLDADNDTSVTADTDDQIDFEIAGQDSISFTQSASHFLMDVYLRYPTLEKTAVYTLTTADSGALVTNKGASELITITLPAATAGLGYCFGVYEVYSITIVPDASDLIYHLTNSAGDRLQNTGTAGDSVCLYALDGIDWFPTQEIGTWSDVD